MENDTHTLSTFSFIVFVEFSTSQIPKTSVYRSVYTSSGHLMQGFISTAKELESNSMLRLHLLLHDVELCSILHLALISIHLCISVESSTIFNMTYSCEMFKIKRRESAPGKDVSIKAYADYMSVKFM